jgi:hypothetical protein
MGDVLEGIGNTPLVRINKISKTAGLQCELCKWMDLLVRTALYALWFVKSLYLCWGRGRGGISPKKFINKLSSCSIIRASELYIFSEQTFFIVMESFPGDTTALTVQKNCSRVRDAYYIENSSKPHRVIDSTYVFV